MCGRRRIDDCGRTPLINAVRRYQYDEIRKLLNRDASIIDDQDYNGMTALHHAAKLGFCIDLLLEYHPYLEMQDNAGNTPLMLACAEGRCRVIKLFITNGANVNTRNVAFKRPISLLTQKGHVQCTDLAIKHGAHFVDADDWKCMIEKALVSDKDDMVEYIIGISGRDFLANRNAVECLVHTMNLPGVEYYIKLLMNIGVSRRQLLKVMRKRPFPETVQAAHAVFQAAHAALGTVMSLKACCRVAIRLTLPTPILPSICSKLKLPASLGHYLALQEDASYQS